MKILSNPSPIKSIQRGIVTMSSGVPLLDVPVANFDMGKTVLNFSVASSSSDTSKGNVRGKLEGGNNIQFYRYSNTSYNYISWELAEYV